MSFNNDVMKAMKPHCYIHKLTKIPTLEIWKNSEPKCWKSYFFGLNFEVMVNSIDKANDDIDVFKPEHKNITLFNNDVEDASRYSNKDTNVRDLKKA